MSFSDCVGKPMAFMVAVMVSVFVSGIASAAGSGGSPISIAPVSQLPSKVIVYGANLDEAGRKRVDQLIRDAGLDPKGAQAVLFVTNDEEREALSGKVPDAIIGTRSISSVYVEKRPQGSGLEAITKNINVMTADMYRSAMATGGIKDARIVACSPIAVSGTAALTGVFKAYEAMTGERLGEDAKDVAQAELAEYGELRKALGPEDSVRFMNEIKQAVLEDKVTSAKEIRVIILGVSEKYTKLRLSDAQLDRLVKLFQRMSRLDLTLDGLKGQLKGLFSWAAAGVTKVLGKVEGFIRK